MLFLVSIAHTDDLSIIGLVIVCFSWIMVPIYLVLCIGIILKYKNVPIMIEREVILLLFTLIFCSMECLINRPFMMYFRVWCNQNDMILTPLMIVAFYGIFWWLMFGLYALRVWKLYYKQQYNIAIKNEIWENKLNSNASNWFIQHKHNFGSTKWLFKMLMIIYIFVLITGPSIQFLSNPNGSLIVTSFNIIWILLPQLVGFIIFCKASKINDIYFIRYELLYVTICIAVCYILYIMTFFAFFIHSQLHQHIGNDKHYHRRLQYLIFGFLGLITNCAIALISTIYPLIVIKRYKKFDNKSISSLIYKSGNIIKPNTDSFDGLYQIFKDKWSLSLFLDHLVQEFSTESVLFIIELIEIQNIYTMNDKEIALHFDLNECRTIKCLRAEFEEITENKYAINIELAKGVVIASHLIDSNDIQFRSIPIDQCMKNVYDKYCKWDSLYPITISSEQRFKLQNIFEPNLENKKYERIPSNDYIESNKHITNYNQNENILHIFDSIVASSLYLLHSSFQRFQRLEEYSAYFYI